MYPQRNSHKIIFLCVLSSTTDKNDLTIDGETQEAANEFGENSE